VASTERKVVRAAPIWPLAGILVAALAVVLVIFYVSGSDYLVHRRKVVTLQMSWHRGDNFYGPNFVHLESPCLSNSESGCFCANDFKTTKTKEFADYVATFGNGKIPVQYQVDYVNGQPVGASLLSVGAWPKSRLDAGEISLATGFKLPTPTSLVHSRNPLDCFPPFGG